MESTLTRTRTYTFRFINGYDEGVGFTYRDSFYKDIEAETEAEAFAEAEWIATENDCYDYFLEDVQ